MMNPRRLMNGIKIFFFIAVITIIEKPNGMFPTKYFLQASRRLKLCCVAL